MARTDALRWLDAYGRGEELPELVLEGDDDEPADEGEDELERDERGEPLRLDLDVTGEGATDGRVDEGRRPDPLPDRVEAVASAILPPGVIDRLADARTPGGIFGMVAGLVLLVFLLVPAEPGGATRFELIWRSLTGGVALPPTQRATVAASVQPVDTTLQAVEQAAVSEWDSFWGGI